MALAYILLVLTWRRSSVAQKLAAWAVGMRPKQYHRVCNFYNLERAGTPLLLGEDLIFIGRVG